MCANTRSQFFVGGVKVLALSLHCLPPKAIYVRSGERPCALPLCRPAALAASAAPAPVCMSSVSFARGTVLCVAVVSSRIRLLPATHTVAHRLRVVLTPQG